MSKGAAAYRCTVAPCLTAMRATVRATVRAAVRAAVRSRVRTRRLVRRSRVVGSGVVGSRLVGLRWHSSSRLKLVQVLSLGSETGAISWKLRGCVGRVLGNRLNFVR